MSQVHVATLPGVVEVGRSSQQDNAPGPQDRSTYTGPSRNPPGVLEGREVVMHAKEAFLSRKATKNKGVIDLRMAEAKHLRSADEGMQVLIGPMPVEEFLDEFLPKVDESGMPDSSGAFDYIPANAKNNKEIYLTLIKAINENGRCPGLTLVDTSVTSEQREGGVCKPEITIYDEGDVSLLRRLEDATPGISYTCANLGIAQTFWSVGTDSQDPFCDDHGNDKCFFDWQNHKIGKRKWKKKKIFFGENISFAAEGCARQHRGSYLSVLIIGTKARFLRWDRAGTVVTKSFDYQQNPKLLCRYLWRFSHASMVERGFDPTVTIASENETRLFESAVSEQIAFQKGLCPDDKEELEKLLKVHYQENKVIKIVVHDGSPSPAGEYLVSVPVRSPFFSAGRSSRGYWSTRVVRAGDGSVRSEVGFLKDIWRVDLSGLSSEGSILAEMAGNVPNIPELDRFGDCPDYGAYDNSEEPSTDREPVVGASGEVQTTKTQDYVGKEWVSKSCCVLPERSDNDLRHRIVKHIHYRMISKTVGYPLSDFTDAQELFLALSDVLKALIVAYQKFGRLHRDVSLDNIILCRHKEGDRRTGILIDWEFSCLVDEKGRARDRYRSGTWAFMSTNLLERTCFCRHLHQDDLESFFYVSVYCALRWLPHNEYRYLGAWMFEFFDKASLVHADGPVGGDKKCTFKLNPRRFSRTFDFKNDFINAWFKNAFNDLSTFRPIMVETLAWTSETVQENMRAVCNGLTSLDHPRINRVEHSMADKSIPEEPYFWVSYISDVKSGSQLSAISELGQTCKRSFSESEDSSEESSLRNKRARQEELPDDWFDAFF